MNQYTNGEPHDSAATGWAVLEAELLAAQERPDRRIAPERHLAARSDLTRSAVRRWLLDLAREGRVTRHVGRGTFVQAQAMPGGEQDLRVDVDGPLDTSPAEIMEVRLLFEPQLLLLAVAKATAGDIRQMRRCLHESEAAESFADFERWDSALHATIAKSTHNRLLIRLFEVMNEARHHPLWGSAKKRSFTPQRRAEYEQDHRALVDAVEDRDAGAAGVVMRRHLTRVQGALIGLSRAGSDGGSQSTEG